MTRFVSWESAQATRRAGESIVGNVSLMRSDFFGPQTFFYSMSKDERMRLHEELLRQTDAPHAFLIEVPPNSTTPAHFHRVPQFQVFVQGGGRLGRRHAVASGTIHYTDEFTGYGPIVAGVEGTAYFTLRGFFDPGAEYVDRPDAREKMKPSAKRYLLVGDDRVALSSDADFAERDGMACDCVIEAHDDGLSAHILRAAPGAAFTGPDPSQGGGQYWLILNGSLVHGGVEYGKYSLGWISRSDGAFATTAGGQGVELGIFQFPRALTSRASDARA